MSAGCRALWSRRWHSVGQAAVGGDLPAQGRTSHDEELSSWICLIPDDGCYEYSAITSNLDYTLANLWHFMAGRGAHEKTIAQLKSGLAFHTVPTLAYAANSAWQQLVALTHNLLTNFQIDTGAERRRRSRKRTALPRL